MKSKTYKEFRYSILVKAEDLTYLETFLKNDFPELNYVANCAGDTKLEDLRLPDLLNYENPSFRRIEGIKITATNKEFRNQDYISIEIGKTSSFYEKTVIVSLHFEDIRRQIPIEKELLTRLESLKAWYSFLSKLPMKYLLPACIVVAAMLTSAKSLFEKLSGNKELIAMPLEPRVLTDGEGLILTSILFAILFGIGYAIDSLRDYLFPAYFFCIGRQKEEFDRRRRIGNFLFVIVFVGVLINLLATKLAPYI